jgi:peptidoglycan/LPS O-acetylase OafA/YrhL
LVYSARSPVGEFLNWRPVAWVGVLSYSLYVWQQFLLNRASTALVQWIPAEYSFGLCCRDGLVLPLGETFPGLRFAVL